MDTPELAKKTEAELRADAQDALDSAQNEAHMLESKFVTMWKSYKAQVIAIAIAAVLVGSLIGHVCTKH